MPRIFDNIQEHLLDTLRSSLEVARRADFCVGYLNLRGWQAIDDLVEKWVPSNGEVCRVLVGMQRPRYEDVRELYRAAQVEGGLDNAQAARLKSQFAAQLREQITIGIPTGKDEAGLRRFAGQLRAGQVLVKLFLPHPLHAKLYLLFREDVNNPVTGFVGSSNLTLHGLSKQGELNVDVLDHQGTQRLSQWFEDRWNERWAIDVSAELADIIETSWAREALIPPYHIYLKMAFHLSTEARAGLSQFQLPSRFEQDLFDFQKSAVKIAARHLARRGGVLIGDVVGLGKTIMATALARVFEDGLGLETLIVCPKNLESMWQHYRTEYGLRGKVMSLSQVTRALADTKAYRLVLIDESHNLRNREGKRYKAIADYIRTVDARVILLSATPYNKTKTDLSSQLRLFVDEKANIGIRPEHHMRKHGLSEAEFERRWQCKVNSIVAMEKSEEFDDWRELIRLYMVRRTRSFIIEHYANSDQHGRPYIETTGGERRYFPKRCPHSLDFPCDDRNPGDRYARLYSDAVVDVINALHVPRYGLGNYVEPKQEQTASPAERKLVGNLGRAGKRLMGFCRTNLFKRLESSGSSFLQSIERHILRNEIYLYALGNGKDLPLGVLDSGVLDADRVDEDFEGLHDEPEDLLDGMVEAPTDIEPSLTYVQAEAVYAQYAGQYKRRFKWISPRFFKPILREHLEADTQALRELLREYGPWSADEDRKLATLIELVRQQHADRKVLVFTQFADTARYLARELQRAGVKRIEAATGASMDPYALACRFSPHSNQRKVNKSDELRVLVCTDVLSEGQNLQDCNIVVNYDLPWAIIRLIQRVGRVDRIGQGADEIQCYSFLPTEGVERLIRLRERIQQRLNENAEVVGTDEAFFEDDDVQALRDLYHEKSDVLDDNDDEVDLASYAWQIWKDATGTDTELARAVEALPPVVYSARNFRPNNEKLAALGAKATQGGALVYVKSPDDNDHLAWIGQDGKPVTESQFLVLKAAECGPQTPAVQRADNHHELVAAGLELAMQQDKGVGGGLGRPSAPRRRAYDRLKHYASALADTLFRDQDLERALDDMYQHPLLETAADLLNRLLRGGVADQDLAEAVKTLREEGRLTFSDDEAARREPRIVCSLGLLGPRHG
ncbi:MAG: helicase-related protein [Rhodanobacteraceae bacterium]